jgi:hypothetical protein
MLRSFLYDSLNLRTTPATPIELLPSKIDVQTNRSLARLHGAILAAAQWFVNAFL